MLAEITALLIAYRYWAIFPFALFEAPLMSIVIGFFAATGQLDLLLAFGIVVLGDVIGDTALYIFGRWCRPFFEKLGYQLKLSPERVQRTAAQFRRHDRRAIVISKLVHGVGFTGLIAAGSLRVPYHRFIATSILVTVLQSAVLTLIGLLSGQAYQAFADYLGYFDIVAGGVTLAVLFLLYRSFARNIGERP